MKTVSAKLGLFLAVAIQVQPLWEPLGTDNIQVHPDESQFKCYPDETQIHLNPGESQSLHKNFPHLPYFVDRWICKCNHCGQELSRVDNLSMHKIRKHKSIHLPASLPLAIQLDLNQTQHFLSFGSEYGQMTVIGEEGTTKLTSTKIVKSLFWFYLRSILWYYQASNYCEMNKLNIQCKW